MPTETQDKETASSQLTDLLNRVEAMLDSGAGRTSELAEYLRPGDPKNETRVGEWVRSRYRTPNGEMALRLFQWAAEKTLEISRSRAKGRKYRKAYAAVCAKRKEP